jgi:CheY-like chemotaxis protein
MLHLADPAGKVNGPKICVLLVDDNETFLYTTADVLQGHHGLAVASATGGAEEAQTQAQDLRPLADRPRSYRMQGENRRSHAEDHVDPTLALV